MRIVTHVQLTKALFVPGLTEFKRTLNHQFYPGMVMKLHPNGVICSFKGLDFIVPASMAECIVLSNDAQVEDNKEFSFAKKTVKSA